MFLVLIGTVRMDTERLVIAAKKSLLQLMRMYQELTGIVTVAIKKLGIVVYPINNFFLTDFLASGQKMEGF